MALEIPQKKIITPQEAAEELLFRARARDSLAEYIHYTSGSPVPRHVRVLCDKLHQMMDRKFQHLLVCWPPGHIKSGTVSWRFPAYYLSKFTDHAVISVTHTESFSEQWGRRVRNLMMSDEHRHLFPQATISEDSRAAARWETNLGGMYFATGVGGAVTGRRSHLVILDDVISGQEAAQSKTVRDNLWDWYGADLLTRALPNCITVFITTRWHVDDLAGRLLAAEKAGGDKWQKLVLPAFAEKGDPLGREEGEPLWPEVFSKPVLENIKRQPSMTAARWSSLYQQNPVVEGGNLIRREWIKIWNQPNPPQCKFILQSWDTATSKEKKAAYSVCLTFGVFQEAETNVPSIILLSRWRGRVIYADLRPMAQRLARCYLDDHKDIPRYREGCVPDTILIEDKATGLPLIGDLSRAGIMATRFRPEKYGSKDDRLNLVTDIFENGRFYVPGAKPSFTMPMRWADDYVTNLCAFPAMESRDDADATSQALIYLKRQSWVYNTEDPPIEEPSYRPQPRGALYG